MHVCSEHLKSKEKNNNDMAMERNDQLSTKQERKK